MITLDPVTGPECVRCGCRDCVVLAEVSTIPNPHDPTGTARPWVIPGRAICKHCDTRFTFTELAPEPPKPVFSGPECPRCKSVNVKIASSPQAKNGTKRRYCTCEDCRAKFSIDEPA